MKEYQMAHIATELLCEQHRMVPIGIKAGFELTRDKRTYYVICERDPLLPLYHVGIFLHILNGKRLLCVKVMMFTVGVDELLSGSRQIS